MKRILSLVLILCCVFFMFVGCDDSKYTTDEEISDLIDRANSVLADNKTELEKLIEEEELTLTAKDVQYDMLNTLSQSFALEGYAELSDYYNYGFTEAMSKIIFAVRVTPSSKNYSDSWYLYCDRETFANLFDDLKEKDKIYIVAKCLVPKELYQEGQGNMALAESIRW